jgi:hypothetical protein
MQVKISELENIKQNATNTDKDDVANTTFFLPIISAYLGIISAEIIQPKKKLLPIAPISISVAHIRFSY